VNIASGKKHQIRRHLKSINHPLVGDRLYGDPDTHEELQLYAVQLQFACPVNGETVDVALPSKLYQNELEKFS